MSGNLFYSFSGERNAMMIDIEGRSPDGVELIKTEDGPQLHFSLSLSIEFDNGSIQSVPLEATVVMPSLQLAKDTLDFGVCLIGQMRELTVILSNPTDCDSYWHCKQGSLVIMIICLQKLVVNS